MKVGLTYDLRTDYFVKDGDPLDGGAEFDHPDTISLIDKALKSRGYEVVMIGNVRSLLENLNKLYVDIVFNIAEGLEGRNRESQVPVILEMADIPFVGADGLTMALTLDKLIAKKLLISDGLPTPGFVEIKEANKINGLDLKYPLIVKPRYEGSSKGLSEKSVVTDMARLKEQAQWVINTYKQSALAEEFVSGQEFTVGIIGNGHPQALPVVQIKIDGKLDLGDLFYTFSRITSTALEYICPASIPRSLEKELQELAIKTYRAVECRDFGRVDFRVDKDGRPYVLEINALPSLAVEDIFGVVPQYMDTTFEDLINRILNAALKRYGMV